MSDDHRRICVARCLLGLLLAAAAPSEAASGAHGVVAAEHRLASEAGIEMLRRGGNAVDAAVAAAFTVCVVNPSSCGIGGGGFMLIYLGRGRRTVALDYREVAPAAASRDMFVRNGTAVAELSRIGGLAVGVPGEVAGLTAALRRYGTLPLPVVMERAIAYARDGVPVGIHLAGEIARMRDALRAQPELARTFLRADGTARQAGETLRQPELAETLQHIAREGAAGFYHGEIPERIATSVQAAGGVVAAADVQQYRPIWRRPIEMTFRGFGIHAMPPPSSAGVVLEVLAMLRHDDLSALGHNSATYAHLLAEAMQHAFADRARLYGDPTHGSDVPLHWLLSPAHAQALRRRISATRTFDQSAYGSASTPPDHGTSHLSVLDEAGNAVACTTTINTPFGSLVVAGGTGIILNNEMDDFSVQPGVPNVYGLVGTRANAIAPGKRPLSSMSPIIAMRHGLPVLAAGGSGGPLIISGTLQVLLNTLAFDFDVEAAVAAARIHDQWVPPQLLVEPGLPAMVRDTLARYGHSVKEVPAMGAVQAVLRHAGTLEGASDPRKGGEAIGW